MFEHKIIFTGPVGAGKTTLIKAFSGTEPVLTEVRASDEVSQLKENTTVAMDYGSVLVKPRRTLLSENFHTPMDSFHCWQGNPPIFNGQNQ